MFQCPSVKKDATRARREPQPQHFRESVSTYTCMQVMYIYIGSEIHTIALSDKQGASLVGPRTIGPYWGNSLIHNCNHVTNSSVRHTNVGSVFQGEPIYLRHFIRASVACAPSNGTSYMYIPVSMYMYYMK